MLSPGEVMVWTLFAFTWVRKNEYDTVVPAATLENSAPRIQFRISSVPKTSRNRDRCAPS
jgi:hypothetical protein